MSASLSLSLVSDITLLIRHGMLLLPITESITRVESPSKITFFIPMITAILDPIELAWASAIEMVVPPRNFANPAMNLPSAPLKSPPIVARPELGSTD